MTPHQDFDAVIVRSPNIDQTAFNMDESTKEATEGWRWFSRDFVLGQERPEHRHADAQLLYAMRGVMLVKSGTVRPPLQSRVGIAAAVPP